jgi:hypothetical protein
MKENIKKRIEDMNKKANNRPVELVFYDKRLKKSVGLRKSPSDLLRDLDDDSDEERDRIKTPMIENSK